MCVFVFWDGAMIVWYDIAILRSRTEAFRHYFSLFLSSHRIQRGTTRRSLGNTKFWQTLDAKVGTNGFANVVAVKGKGLDAFTTQHLGCSGTKDFGNFETTGATIKTNFANFFTFRHHADTKGLAVNGEARLTDEAQAFVGTVATKNNIVQIDGLVAVNTTRKHAMVRHYNAIVVVVVYGKESNQGKRYQKRVCCCNSKEKYCVGVRCCYAIFLLSHETSELLM